MKKKIIIIGLGVIVVAAIAVYILTAPPKAPETSYYSPGDYFVTNIKDSTRLLKTTIVLELLTQDPETTDEYLAGINHMIRDIIIFALREKNENELRSDGIEQTLSTEISKKLNDGLGIDYVVKIYFNDFVIQ